jgi:hypothetical protein
MLVRYLCFQYALRDGCLSISGNGSGKKAGAASKGRKAGL